MPEMPTKEYFEAILRAKVDLDHVAMARMLLESDNPVTRDLAAEYYPKFWEDYCSQTGELRTCYFGQHAPWGIILTFEGHYDCEYRREIVSLAPASWERQLQGCDEAIHTVQQTLSGSQQSIILRELFGLVYMLFSAIDGVAANPESEAISERLNETVAFVDEHRREIETNIRRLVLERDRRSAQQTYLLGMLPGLALIGILLAALSIETKIGLPVELAIGGGALGAILSVLARTTRAQTEKSLKIDYEVGQALIFCAGLFRPIVGALLASALYVIINAGLIPLKIPEGSQGEYFIAAIAFLSGFSERLAQDALVRTSRATF